MVNYTTPKYNAKSKPQNIIITCLIFCKSKYKIGNKNLFTMLFRGVDKTLF